jgi:hypothetical protein
MNREMTPVLSCWMSVELSCTMIVLKSWKKFVEMRCEISGNELENDCCSELLEASYSAGVVKSLGDTIDGRSSIFNSLALIYLLFVV